MINQSIQTDIFRCIQCRIFEENQGILLGKISFGDVLFNWQCIDIQYHFENVQRGNAPCPSCQLNFPLRNFCSLMKLEELFLISLTKSDILIAGVKPTKFERGLLLH
jgi:hypothetical protein